MRNLLIILFPLLFLACTPVKTVSDPEPEAIITGNFYDEMGVSNLEFLSNLTMTTPNVSPLTPQVALTGSYRRENSWTTQIGQIAFQTNLESTFTFSNDTMYYHDVTYEGFNETWSQSGYVIVHRHLHNPHRIGWDIGGYGTVVWLQFDWSNNLDTLYFGAKGTGAYWRL